jgi:DNA recombination protein RmuC
VQKHLETINQSIEQIKGTDQALSKELKSLQQETAKIAGAMHNPASRGKWGEYVLERLLERSGLVKDIHFQTQNTIASGERTLRPDIIIHLQDDMRIVIDSKAPVQEIVDDLQDGEKEKDVAAKLAKAVRGHIKALGQKSYQDSLNSPDFVVLFLPAEHLFSMAVSADPTLIDYAAENNIVLASPILILSILRVVKMSWQSHDLAENAKDIAEAGATLYKRLGVFTEHLDKMGHSMQTSIKHYNNAVGSFERNVLPQARKFEELHALSTPQSLEAPKSLEIAPRTVLKQAD